MSVEQVIRERCGEQCELCGATTELSVYEIPPVTTARADQAVMLCGTCRSQIEGGAELDMNHWRCLNDSMWSQVPAVQVMAYRMLKRLSGETWAQDLKDMLYLDEETQAWADSAAIAGGEDDDTVLTRDCNGTVLQAGDDVTLIKDLNVKGAGFTAKRGTMVRGISLSDNPEHIEGRVNGVRVVLVSAYLKKA